MNGTGTGEIHFHIGIHFMVGAAGGEYSMENVIYTDSLYTSAIIEIERAADLIDSLASDEPAAVRAFAVQVSSALRMRCDRLRADEAAAG